MLPLLWGRYPGTTSVITAEAGQARCRAVLSTKATRDASLSSLKVTAFPARVDVKS